jgi:hypothetical protein
MMTIWIVTEVHWGDLDFGTWFAESPEELVRDLVDAFGHIFEDEDADEEDREESPIPTVADFMAKGTDEWEFEAGERAVRILRRQVGEP